MATKSQKKDTEETTEVSEGVPVRTFDTRPARYQDGVPVLTPDAPAQSAGSDDGQSAGNKEK